MEVGAAAIDLEALSHIGSQSCSCLPLTRLREKKKPFIVAYGLPKQPEPCCLLSRLGEI